MAKAPSLNVLISGDPKALLAAFATSNAAAAGWAAKMKAVAISPAGIFAAGAVGVGVALAKIGSDFDVAFDAIRVGTGATGEQLGALEESFKNVVKQVPAEFGDAGTAIAELNTRLGLTGAPLEGLASQLLELSRITETDLAGNVAAVSSVFQNFGVGVEEQGPKLDLLFRTSQATGVSVADLAATMADSGVVLRQVGLDFDQSAALLGTLSKAGVDAGDVMPALSRSLATAAKDGKDAGDVFAETFAAIKGAPDDVAASGAALEVFGARAGPRLSALIREGKLSYEDLLGTITTGGETIMGAGEDTKDFAEQLTELKNNAMVALEPVATQVFGALGDAMGWVTDNANWLIPVLAVAAGAIAAVAAVTAVLNIVMAANPIALVVIAIAALVAGLVWAYNNVDWFRSAVETAWNAITAAVSWAWENVLRPVWDLIYWYIENVLIRYVQVLWTVYSTVWNAIAAAVTWAWENVLRPVWDAIWWFVESVLVPTFQALWETVRTVWEGVTSAVGTAWTFLSDVFGKLMFGIELVRGWIGDKVEAVVGFFTSLPGRIAGAVVGLWDGLTNSFRNAINVIIGLWNGLAIPSFTIGGWDAFGVTLPSFTTPRIEFPDLPVLHSGGVFAAPRPGGEGLALLRDGERVLTRAQQVPTVAGRDPLAGVVVNVAATNADPAEIGRALLWTMKVVG